MQKRRLSQRSPKGLNLRRYVIVLTFLVLTVIGLGLSFLYDKFADRLKESL